MIDDPREEDDPNEGQQVSQGEPEEDEEDAGLLDDESGDEAAGAEAEEDEGEERVVAKPVGRATRAVQEAKKLAQENAARADRLEREMAELRAERDKPKGESPEQEAARLSLMTPDERVEYRLNKASEENKRQLALMQFQMNDRADKSSFDAKAASNPRYAKYANEVEQLLLAERKAGRDFPRETILKFIVGQRVLDAKPEVKKQQAQGKRRVEQERTRVASSGSDRAAPRGRSGGNDLARRLENINI